MFTNKKFYKNGSIITFENYSNIDKLGRNKDLLNIDIKELLVSCWGVFPDDFIDKHILRAQRLLIARKNTECIGVCVMNIKVINGIKFHYIEFLLVNKLYQKSGLGSHLFYLMIRREIFKNILGLIFGKSLEILFITPNIRVLSRIAKFASFIYPNPLVATDEGTIPSADDRTWAIAQFLINNSDNPTRIIERSGLVLIGSYRDTPWLIYNNDNAPWHYDDKINLFARRYLGYHNNEDREFIVRAHLNIFSIVRYLIHISPWK